MLKFFFWLYVTPLQRNARGLWASPLFQLLWQNVSIVDELIHHDPQSSQRSDLSDWSQKALPETFLNALGLSSSPVCIFLDGLDEFDWEAGAFEILELVKKLSLQPMVKLCVSSRRELEFQTAFHHDPNLRLQDLTLLSLLVWR